MADLGHLCRAVQEVAGGLLPVEVYAALYEAASGAAGSLVEVGTAYGAATIILATAAPLAHVYSVDLFRGRRFAAFDGPASVIDAVRAQFARFDVDQRITLVTGTSDDLVAQHDFTGIGLVLLDADGRIDRDLAALTGRLAPGCQVIVDDIDDHGYVDPQRQRVDLKHCLAHRLCAAFVAKGFLTPVREMQKTTPSRVGFFVKGAVEWTREALLLTALPAYRSLVFAEVAQVKRRAV